MIPLTPPPLIEVLRADTSNVETAVASLLEFYNPVNDARFNYLRSVKTARVAYQGLHRIDQLLAAPPSVKAKVGFKPNQDVISLVCPVAFGRSTQVFDLGSRKFPFGRDRFASYRIPFFFTEGGVVKLYFLQYRKGFYVSRDIYEGMMLVHRRYLLDQEFYGDSYDVEYIDCSAEEDKGPRILKRYSSSNLEVWTDERLQDQLGMVATAMDAIEARSLKVKRIRPLRDSSLPLFD